MSLLILVVGPAASGTRLVAKIVAHVKGVMKYGGWDGNECIEEDGVCVRHVSFPDAGGFWPDLAEDLKKSDFDEVKIVMCIRDRNIVMRAQVNNAHCKSGEEVASMKIARRMLASLVLAGFPCMLFSYETMMYMQIIYLSSLYCFIGEKSSFVPELIDANRKYLKE